MSFERGIAVVGLGYIGLPTSAAIAMQGVEVKGVDVNEDTVAAINLGRAPIVEPDLDVAVAGAHARGLLSASTEVPEADVFMIAVPTPFKDGHQPDLSYVRAAACRSHPSCAAERWSSSSRPPHRAPPGWSPSGWPRRGPTSNSPTRPWTPPMSTWRTARSGCCPGASWSSWSPTTASSAASPRVCPPGRRGLRALLQGRDPLHRRRDRRDGQAGGELLPRRQHRLRQRAGRRLRAAGARRLGGHPAGQPAPARRTCSSPGPGVGGHCIAVDPWFIVAAAPEHDRADPDRPRDQRRPARRRSSRRHESSAADNGAPIACLGLAFKADIDDLRESPAVTVTAGLAAAMPDREILAVEPNVADPAACAAAAPQRRAGLGRDGPRSGRHRGPVGGPHRLQGARHGRPAGKDARRHAWHVERPARARDLTTSRAKGSS